MFRYAIYVHVRFAIDPSSVSCSSAFVQRYDCSAFKLAMLHSSSMSVIWRASDGTSQCLNVSVLIERLITAHSSVKAIYRWLSLWWTRLQWWFEIERDSNRQAKTKQPNPFNPKNKWSTKAQHLDCDKMVAVLKCVSERPASIVLVTDQTSEAHYAAHTLRERLLTN